VAGDLRTEGDKTVEGHLTVGNPTTELTGNGEMTVAGSTRMEGNLRVDADADINNIYTKTEVDDLISGGGTDGQFNNLVVGNPNTELTGAGELTTASNARIEGGLNVTGGNISGDQDLGVDGFARIGAPSNQLSGAGDLTVANDLRVEGNIEDHYTTTEVDNLLADKADTGQDENFSRLVVGNPNTTLTDGGDLTVAGDARLEGLLIIDGGNQVADRDRLLMNLRGTPNGQATTAGLSVQDIGGVRVNRTSERADVTFGSQNMNPLVEMLQFLPADPSTENYLLTVRGTDGEGNFDQLSDFQIGRTVIGRPNTQLNNAGDLTVAGDLRVEGSSNITAGTTNVDTLVVGNPNTTLTSTGDGTFAGDVRIEGTASAPNGSMVANTGSFDKAIIGTPATGVSAGDLTIQNQLQTEDLLVVGRPVNTETIPGSATLESNLRVYGETDMRSNLLMNGNRVVGGVFQPDNSANSASADAPQYDPGSLAILALDAADDPRIGFEFTQVTYNTNAPSILFGASSIATTEGTDISIPGRWQLIGQTSPSIVPQSGSPFDRDAQLYLIYRKT
jgi:hypothetical protein